MRNSQAEMRIEKGNHDEEDYGDDEFGPKRDCPSSNITLHKDAKNSDKAVMRSKHSVTEQRRRSKINERFQVLRELIPHGEQKRDTASFLTEVIEYVQFLQEKLQKYEGSSPGWTPEPTKLMPWRNSHWRVQGFVNHLQSINNGSGPPGKFEENNMTTTPEVVPRALIRVESDADRDEICGSTDRQLELDSKGLSLAMSVASIPQHDHQSNESPARIDVSGQTEDQVIEGGTINISSVYSHELLNSLTQALQKAGIDLSHARLSVRIDLGKRSNQGVTSSKDPLSDNEGIMQLHKRMKT